MKSRRGHVLQLIFVFCLISQVEAVAFAPTPAAVEDFSGWHLPLPAGQWTISRGPCGSAANYNHACDYYEDHCGIDFIPISGSMENVPVLAPQAGRVFFLGTRFDAGLAVMLRHADGRLSAMFHLSKAVVGLDQLVGQGQVIGYAGGTGSASKPHLHFHVQQNAVERNCVELKGLDGLDYQRMIATSRNLAWTELILPDPPEALPDWLPLQLPTQPAREIVLPAELLLARGAEIYLPVAVTRADAENLIMDGATLKPTRRSAHQVLFNVPITASGQPGHYEKTFWSVLGAQRGAAVTLDYVIRPAQNTAPGQGMILLNPTFVSPSNWSTLRLPPRLCWREDASAGKSPLRFRILVVGPTAGDSGWVTDSSCWQTPNLKAGTYFWKVFVRDARGYMNRTNQRPYAFTIR